MRVAVFLGTRNKHGQTARACGSLVSGLRESGVEVDRCFLPDRKVAFCRQCGKDGWGPCHRGTECVIDDDFTLLVDDLLDSDLVVMATPVYFGDLSESMLAFLGRLRRIQHKGGLGGIMNRPAVAICVAGGSGRGAFRCVESMDCVLSKCGFDVLDIIPVRRQNLELKCDVLERTGQLLGRDLYRFLTMK